MTNALMMRRRKKHGGCESRGVFKPDQRYWFDQGDRIAVIAVKDKMMIMIMMRNAVQLEITRNRI